MGVSRETSDSFVDRAAMLWSLYSAAGPFEGVPVPETSAEFGRLILANVDTFKAAGQEGIQTLMDLQKATMDYDRFKAQTKGLTGTGGLFPDKFVRD
jgi:hypothetical protein